MLTMQHHRPTLRTGAWLAVLLFSLLPALAQGPSTADAEFEAIAKRFLSEAPAFSPVGATQLGDHRYDGQLDEATPAARDRETRFYRELQHALERTSRNQLSRANRVDAALLAHDLEARIWSLEVLKEWEWNPLVYTGVCGSAVYGLVAREFAPLPDRLRNVTARLQQYPRFLEQARSALVPTRIPKVHAETAVKQNPGVLSILDDMVQPHLGQLPESDRRELEQAMKTARAAVEKHQQWLEQTMLPQAKGNFRVGSQLFDKKLSFALMSPLSRKAIRERALSELKSVRAEMYLNAREVYQKEYPSTLFPAKPSEAYQQAIIRSALEIAYRQLPPRDRIVETAKAQLEEATAFVRAKNLVTVPADPVDVIVMPEFQRGVSVAYCDSPGPLDVGMKTFYAVSPLPKDWTEEQVRSFLREYNLFSLNELTIHEAMPGHYLQGAHANRYPSKLRAVLSSGTFVEGWAVYTEKLMVDSGYQNGDPLMRLINNKWYLRGIANALMDQAIHCDGMNREQAMKLMVEKTFQEEREAAGKWVRAQLTSAQLSTYFVGYQEHRDLRREVEKARGNRFQLKEYNDQVISFGAPPIKFVRALMLNEPIPGR